jgi:hypothetical protein
MGGKEGEPGAFPLDTETAPPWDVRGGKEWQSSAFPLCGALE